MSSTRSGEYVSAQVGKMGIVSDLNIQDFKLNAIPFQLKNDGVQPIELTVQLNGMEDSETVTTIFEVGWNPEIIKRIVKTASSTGTALKWGY